MADSKRKRGRPKGSGIDDAKILAQMASMMLADPALTRTTALKAIGIDNPSTQRRIRDKFAMEEKKLLSAARKSGVVPGKPVAKKAAPAKKAAAKAAPASKALAKKAPASKAAAKKAPAAKAPAKKAAAKKPAPKAAAPAKKAASKTAMKASGAPKAAARKAPAKQAPRKAVAKAAAPARRPAAKKAAAKKSGGKKSSKARPGHFAPKASGPPESRASQFEAHIPQIPVTPQIPGAMTPAELTSAMNEAMKAGAPAATAMAKSMADMARANGKRAGVGSSIEAVVSNVVEQQIQLYEAAVKHSPVAALLRQQALVTDMMLTMLKAQKEWARSAK